MPPEFVESLGPLADSGMAGAVAFAVVKLAELFFRVPQMTEKLSAALLRITELERHRDECAAANKVLSEQVSYLVGRLTEPG